MNAQAKQIRAELREQFHQEFEHGYRTGYLGEFQQPCDAAGYPVGFHAWALARKNAWYSAWNLGNVQRQADHG
jgi:hypothetical protein